MTIIDIHKGFAVLCPTIVYNVNSSGSQPDCVTSPAAGEVENPLGQI